MLEVFEEGAKTGKDSPPCTIQEMMEEFEENGSDYTLNNHECVRRDDKAEDEDGKNEKVSGGYDITAKKTKVYFQYAPLTANYKWSNVASFFGVDVAWQYFHLYMFPPCS